VNVDIARRLGHLGQVDGIERPRSLPLLERVLEPPELVERSGPEAAAIRADTRNAGNGPLEDHHRLVVVASTDDQLVDLLRGEDELDLLPGQPLPEAFRRLEAQARRALPVAVVAGRAGLRIT